MQMVDRSSLIRQMIERWRDDPGATYQSWFLWDERIKNFRSIRRGIQQVVAEIEAGSFGGSYRGSSLETVVHSIAETRFDVRCGNTCGLVAVPEQICVLSLQLMTALTLVWIRPLTHSCLRHFSLYTCMM